MTQHTEIRASHVETLENKGHTWGLPAGTVVYGTAGKPGIILGVMVDGYGHMMQTVVYESCRVNYTVRVKGNLVEFNEKNTSYEGFVYLGEYPR